MLSAPGALPGLDELQLIERRSILSRPESSKGEGYEYRQCGKVNLFVAFESLACKSVVKPSDARTAVDLAHSLREL